MELETTGIVTPNLKDKNTTSTRIEEQANKCDVIQRNENVVD